MPTSQKSGGKLKNKLNNIGIAFAHSDEPDFISKASAIKGVRSVIHDLSANWLPPDEESSKTGAAFAPSDFFLSLSMEHACYTCQRCMG